ncbi:MAG: hypothetical protein E7397_03195 [Ruminococcaceae bacterium]|nr:hypothetical protein [Oscillospiraceae bacterium]
MANDMMSTLKGLLGENADEKIQSVLQGLQGSAPRETAEADTPNLPMASAPSPEGLDFLMQMKGLVEQMGNANDSRSNLLLSLRPYMRTGRQKGIDNAVRLLNMARISGLFRNL